MVCQQTMLDLQFTQGNPYASVLAIRYQNWASENEVGVFVDVHLRGRPNILVRMGR